MFNILVVEDSRDRIDFFKELYRLQNAAFVGNVFKAIGLLRTQEFDIIQLDYDLENGSNSENVASFISNNDIKSIVIIHSEHPEGVETLLNILPSAFPIPFSVFNSKNSFSNQWKPLICQSGMNSIDLISKLLKKN